MNKKRRDGQFFTTKNPFYHPAFIDWANSCNLNSNSIVEPFAGSNSLIKHIRNMGFFIKSKSYDIFPLDREVEKRDTFKSFPKGFDICITNPPWLSKNSASVRGLYFPKCKHDNLYKLALEKCLAHCKWIAIIVPESFIRAGIFKERLTDFISLTSQIFDDTEQPVGLALFSPYESNDVKVWSQNIAIGNLAELERLRLQPQNNKVSVKFNIPNGNLGLVALDNTYTSSIRFCPVKELSEYKVKPSGRHITKIKVDGEIKIAKYNKFLNDFREKTYDVLLTSYRGLRKDGMYRRRLDWRLAKGIIQNI